MSLRPAGNVVFPRVPEAAGNVAFAVRIRFVRERKNDATRLFSEVFSKISGAWPSFCEQQVEKWETPL
jgi:hypothetical protein